MRCGYSNQDLTWNGDWLCHHRARLLRIVCHPKRPTLWRIEHPDGTRTRQHLSIVRVREVARRMALEQLNQNET